jgi:hypothetical protein
VRKIYVEAKAERGREKEKESKERAGFMVA